MIEWDIVLVMAIVVLGIFLLGIGGFYLFYRWFIGWK